MRRWIFVLAVLLVLAAPVLAADAVVESASGSEFLDGVLKVLAAAIVSGLSALLGQLVIAIKQKVGIEISSATQEYALNYAKEAVLAAEEKAAAALRKSDIMVSSKEKMASAVASILDKIPGITEKEAEELVSAALPRLGLGALAVLNAATNEEPLPPSPASEE